MKFWFDIVNSPHVLFFKPIIEKLEKNGHKVHITTRKYAQTVELLDEFQLPFTLIGAHAGANIFKKIIDVVTRGICLCKYAQDQQFNMALTFNSPSLTLATRILRIPSMVFMDYEYQPLNHLTFRLANSVVTPAVFPDEYLAKFGALQKTIKYHGLKEQVYLSDFEPDPKFLDLVGIDKNKIVITVRPPPTMALYHRFENDIFYNAVDFLLEHENTVIIAMPRSSEQKVLLEAVNKPNLIIPKRAVDGRNLLFYSDIVISAGGTMNREAAVLGIPAYTVFKGKTGAVDRYLIEQGRITIINNADDFKKIKIAKKTHNKVLMKPELKQELINMVLNYLH